jgi:hypothetical protein
MRNRGELALQTLGWLFKAGGVLFALWVVGAFIGQILESQRQLGRAEVCESIGWSYPACMRGR